MTKPPQFFRAGVGIVVVNDAGAVLALRRADVPGDAWQLPQGGIEDGEAPEDAMWRELTEETGLTRGHCDVAAALEGWLAYELPAEMQNSRVGRGQVQRWFLCRFKGRDSDIAPDGREFDAWRWREMSDLIAEAISFRRPVYRAVANEFADFLA